MQISFSSNGTVLSFRGNKAFLSDNAFLEREEIFVRCIFVVIENRLMNSLLDDTFTIRCLTRVWASLYSAIHPVNMLDLICSFETSFKYNFCKFFRLNSHPHSLPIFRFVLFYFLYRSVSRHKEEMVKFLYINILYILIYLCKSDKTSRTSGRLLNSSGNLIMFYLNQSVLSLKWLNLCFLRLMSCC